MRISRASTPAAGYARSRRPQHGKLVRPRSVLGAVLVGCSSATAMQPRDMTFDYLGGLRDSYSSSEAPSPSAVPFPFKISSVHRVSQVDPPRWDNGDAGNIRDHVDFLVAQRRAIEKTRRIRVSKDDERDLKSAYDDYHEKTYGAAGASSSELVTEWDLLVRRSKIFVGLANFEPELDDPHYQGKVESKDAPWDDEEQTPLEVKSRILERFCLSDNADLWIAYYEDEEVFSFEVPSTSTGVHTNTVSRSARIYPEFRDACSELAGVMDEGSGYVESFDEPWKNFFAKHVPSLSSTILPRDDLPGTVGKSTGPGFYTPSARTKAVAVLERALLFVKLGGLAGMLVEPDTPPELESPPPEKIFGSVAIETAGPEGERGHVDKTLDRLTSISGSPPTDEAGGPSNYALPLFRVSWLPPSWFFRLPATLADAGVFGSSYTSPYRFGSSYTYPYRNVNGGAPQQGLGGNTARLPTVDAFAADIANKKRGADGLHYSHWPLYDVEDEELEQLPAGWARGSGNGSGRGTTKTKWHQLPVLVSVKPDSWTDDPEAANGIVGFYGHPHQGMEKHRHKDSRLGFLLANGVEKKRKSYFFVQIAAPATNAPSGFSTPEAALVEGMLTTSSPGGKAAQFPVPVSQFSELPDEREWIQFTGAGNLQERGKKFASLDGLMQKSLHRLAFEINEALGRGSCAASGNCFTGPKIFNLLRQLATGQSHTEHEAEFGGFLVGRMADREEIGL
eukprot:g6758.t1